MVIYLFIYLCFQPMHLFLLFLFISFFYRPNISNQIKCVKMHCSRFDINEEICESQ